MAERQVEVSETIRERMVIPTTSGFSATISWIACTKPLMISFTTIFHPSINYVHQYKSFSSFTGMHCRRISVPPQGGCHEIDATAQFSSEDGTGFPWMSERCGAKHRITAMFNPFGLTNKGRPGAKEERLVPARRRERGCRAGRYNNANALRYRTVYVC